MAERAEPRDPLENPEDRTNYLALMLECQKLGLHHRVLALWEAASDQFWELGYWKDYLQCGSVTLESADALNDVELQARTLNELGWANMERQEYAVAQDNFKASLYRYRQTKNRGGQSRLLRDLGTLWLRVDRPGSALRYYRRALAIVSEVRSQDFSSDHIRWAHREAELHNLLGNLYFKLHDFPTSQHELHQALDQYRALGDAYRYYQAAPLLNLGRWHFLRGHCDEARQYYTECYELSKELGRTDMVAGALVRLAELAEAEGNCDEASRLAHEAELVSGTEIVPMRERASRLKYRVTGRGKQAPFASLRRLSVFFLMMLDLLLASPRVAFRTLRHYLLTGVRGALD